MDQIPRADLPEDCIVLGEQQTLPHELNEALTSANPLVFLDSLSFPFDAMSGEHWDIPIVAMLPSGFDTESLTAALGVALFERLGFFDHIVTPDSALWEELRRRYQWAEGQRVAVPSDDLGETIVAIRALLEARISTPSHRRPARRSLALAR